MDWNCVGGVEAAEPPKHRPVAALKRGTHTLKQGPARQRTAPGTTKAGAPVKFEWPSAIW